MTAALSQSSQVPFFFLLSASFLLLLFVAWLWSGVFFSFCFGNIFKCHFNSLRSAPWPVVARSNASTSVVVLSSNSARQRSLSCKYWAETDGYLFPRPFFTLCTLWFFCALFLFFGQRIVLYTYTYGLYFLLVFFFLCVPISLSKLYSLKNW